MSNNLNNIVSVNIDLTSPAIDSASFDNLLIVGLPPVTPKGTLPDIGAYSDLDEVESAGYISTGTNADPVGIAARIAFSQNPRPSLLYIAAQQEDGVNMLESPVDTLRRANKTPGWYMICPAGIDESMYEEIAEWTETQNKQFGYTYLADTDPVSEIYYRSHGWCGLVHDEDLPGDVPVANAYLHCGIVAKGLSYPSGSETWAFKKLASVHPSKISSTLIKSIVDGHSNYFAQYAGRNISMNGQVRAGEWIDVIRGRDWLQNDMQIRIFNLLLMNPKVPYTNSGIGSVQNEMIASLKTAQKRGIVAEDEFDEEENLVPGFTTSVPNSMSLTATQKASRILSNCKFSARLAGAIHVIRVDGALTY